MNGVASAKMRQTEDYRVNYGIELPRLALLSQDIDPKIAGELWKSRVRECRIMALMLAVEGVDFDEQMCDVWMDDIRTAEIGQIASLYLFSRLPFASGKAFEWIACEDEVRQICGFSTLCHLLRRNELSARARDEVNDQVEAAMESDCLPLRKIAAQVKAMMEETGKE